MSVSGNYDKVSYIASGKSVRAQSIVECRLNDWGENRVLAVSARAVSVGAETLSGEVRYGGRLYFTVLACTPDGSIVSGERGAEFSHRAECESAAPAQTADVTLTVEKVEMRRDGRALVLSAIVSADVSLFVPAEISYLSGGDGVVCDFRPVRLLQMIPHHGHIPFQPLRPAAERRLLPAVVDADRGEVPRLKRNTHFRLSCHGVREQNRKPCR